MSAVPISETLMTPEEYLAFEDEAVERHEYLHGAIYAMSGGSQNHDLLCGDLFSALNNRLGAGPCLAYTSNMKIRIEEHARGRFYYPDAMVSCGPRTGKNYQPQATAIFEVLSKSTERYDREEKRLAYFDVPELQNYVVISQDRMRVEVWRREGENWDAELLNEPGDILKLPAIGCEIPLAEIYRRVSL